MMRTLMIVSLDLPEPEDITKAIAHIDPPSIPHFAGTIRITVEPTSRLLERWLDSQEE